MSFAKALVTGTLYKAPEKRFTQNNVAVSSFILNLDDQNDMLVRVVAKRNSLDEVVSSLSKGDKVVIEGRLQTNNIKSDDGSERRIFEIEANTIERFGEGNASSSASTGSSKFGTEEIVKIESDDFSNELIGEDEIPF